MNRRKKREQASAEWKRERKQAQRKLHLQGKDAALRARYGPSGKPAPVVVSRVDATGDVLAVKEVDQDHFRDHIYGFVVEAAAVRAGYRNYATYLRSKHWKELRRRVLIRDGWRCKCGNKKDLHVHHDRYDVDLGSDEIGHLKTVCAKCHDRIHGRAAA